MGEGGEGGGSRFATTAMAAVMAVGSEAMATVATAGLALVTMAASSVATKVVAMVTMTAVVMVAPKGVSVALEEARVVEEVMVARSSLLTLLWHRWLVTGRKLGRRKLSRDSW